jgi:hypothetical protein
MTVAVKGFIQRLDANGWRLRMSDSSSRPPTSCQHHHGASDADEGGRFLSIRYLYRSPIKM